MLLRQNQLTRFLMGRKWQAAVLSDFIMPAAALDSSVHEQAINFLLEAFRLVASSGRAGSIGEAFLSLGRWLETLYVNRPAAMISQERNVYIAPLFFRV